jgi:hypothetical protein
VLLQFQEVSLKLHLDPLKLFLGSIALDGVESVCGTKSDEHGALFMGLLALARRGCRVLHFLSINRTQTQFRSEDFGKGRFLGSF